MPIRRDALHSYSQAGSSCDTFVYLTVLLAGLLAGCGGEETASAALPPEGEASRVGEPRSGASEAEGEDDAPPADSGPPKRIFAKRFVVNVRAEPRQDAEKLGYLRAGAVLMATTSEPKSREDGCPRGWYELDTGGFVCNGREVIVFEGDRLPEARAMQPDLDAPLPYEYGRVRTKAPLYRRLPTDEEAAQFEGYVIPGAEPREGVVAGSEGSEVRGPASTTTPTSASAEDGAPRADQPRAAQGGPGSQPRPRPEGSTGTAPRADGSPAVAAAGTAQEAEEPPGPVTLDRLMGEREGVVHRYLVPGFILSLDRVFRSGRRSYYRTQNNGFVPLRRIGPRTGSEFEGVVLEEGKQLPLGFVVQRRVNGYERTEAGRLRPSRAAALEYHAHVAIAEAETEGSTSYLRTPDGRYYRENDLRVLRPVERPEEVPEGDPWIDVNLTDQTLVAYEGDRPVFATLISTGRIRRPGVEDLDHRTPTGVFRIRAKHVTTTMDGDSAFDGPYSIEDVPYVMYFHGAYALHSAFWHDRFGFPKSHGCLNMSPLDARWLFRWAGPRLGEGWHGAFPSEGNEGTWVVVRGETPVG